MPSTERDRSKFLGGSDAAAILGISPWQTPYALWEEKCLNNPESADEEREKFFRRGKRLEPIVIEMLQEERDVWVLDRNQIHIDPEHDFLRAEIDFEYVTDPNAGALVADHVGNGDVKTVHPNMARDWGEEGTDELPAYYVAQFQFGMMVTGRSICMVAALIGADDLRVYFVKRDEEIIAHIRQKALSFWYDNVQAKVAPPLRDASDAARMIERFGGATIKVTDALRDTVRRLVGVKKAVKRLESKQEEYESALKLAIALGVSELGEPRETAIVNEQGRPLVEWNEHKTNRFNQKLFKGSNPHTFELFTRESKYRVLRIKEKYV